MRDFVIFPDSDDEKIVKNVVFEYYLSDSFVDVNTDEPPGVSYISITRYDGELTNRERDELVEVIRETIEREV